MKFNITAYNNGLQGWSSSASYSSSSSNSPYYRTDNSLGIYMDNSSISEVRATIFYTKD